MGEIETDSLKFWCDKIINDPAMQPAEGRTFCNIAVERICRGMGYIEFDGLVANQIYDKCVKDWNPCSPKEANDAAVLGILALAAWKNPDPAGHGHVAMCYPDPLLVYSGKWQTYVPQVANVGKTCGIMGANYAFLEKPDYFSLRTPIP